PQHAGGGQLGGRAGLGERCADHVASSFPSRGPGRKRLRELASHLLAGGNRRRGGAHGPEKYSAYPIVSFVLCGQTWHGRAPYGEGGALRHQLCEESSVPCIAVCPCTGRVGRWKH